MQQVIAQNLQLTLNIPTGIGLVDRNQLANIIKRQSLEVEPAITLDPNKTLGIYARRGIRRGIYIQTGLPRSLFLQIAAHEFAHAWQGENCPTILEFFYNEGLAEWVAYKVLGYYGYTNMQERMLARDDMYGQGLKWALDLEQANGWQAVKQACQTVR